MNVVKPILPDRINGQFLRYTSIGSYIISGSHPKIITGLEV